MAPSTQAPNIFEDAPRSPTKPSVIRALLSGKAHKRNLSADEAFSPKSLHQSKPSENSFQSPFDGLCQQQNPLAEITANRDAGDGARSPTKSAKGGLHKKTKSAVSLKSLKSYMERKDKSTDHLPVDESVEWKPKKAKSANSLSAMLKRSQRNHKDGSSRDAYNKDNRGELDIDYSFPSPTWTPYSAQSLQGQTASSRSPDKRRTLQDEVSLYTPNGYSHVQQRNFYDFQQPALARPSGLKPRPKSDVLSGNRKMKEVLGITPRSTSDNAYPDQPSECASPSKPQRRSGIFSRSRRNSESEQKLEQKAEEKPEASSKQGSRVQAAISAFNAKEQEADLRRRLNAKDLEGEFEKLLDARNIPHNMRDKMRSLDTNIKVDFIQKDRSETGTTPQSANSGTTDSNRRGRKNDQQDERRSLDGKSRSRSRSRSGFAFTKGSVSPTKKRSGSGSSHRRPKSADISQPGGLANILAPAASVTSLSLTNNHDTAADPSDFVHYLREIQKPEMVEVGKIHKLRLLLRNETVSWVDTFIADGGMDEIVQLLHRIMKVEWREEHEDNLLHETLLCMKALCTTSVALEHLTEIEDDLFPALLKMLFDEEKKGPSEFTTRGVIINLLFTQLSAANGTRDATARAGRLLSYLRDPTPPEENQPLGFIAGIYQPRPYRVWCKEVTSVSKEVFWIFLHHLNVIPITKSDHTLTNVSPEDFRQRHFPAARPPVPAAPYVGGVEWDATNYLAAHLDLLNGLVASLPTSQERNHLRNELRASGFEKVMGGSLRTCKEKFYSSVHDCLRTWIAAAVEDGWSYSFVREGPPRPEPGSPTKSPIKAAGGSPKKGVIAEKPPQLELPLPVSNNNNINNRPSPKGEIGNWL